MSLFKELKRRNVIRIAGIYAVVAWILMQVAGTLEASLKLPEWFDSVVTAGLMIGFPIALLLAWAFEMTPEGMRRTEELKEGESISGSKFDGLILLGIVGVLGLGIWQQFGSKDMDSHSTIDNGNDEEGGGSKAVIVNNSDVPNNNSVTPSKSSVIPAKAGIQTIDLEINKKSIAILPFTNMANNPESEPITVGLHDDLLTHISKISALKVISRTSVLRYKDTQKSIGEIAKELGVAHILEGGVQKSGNQIRINVQLIDAKADVHLWAEKYDRELTVNNIFKIQTEISEKIAAALKAQLTPEEKQSFAKIPTDNLEAYNAYLAGRQLLVNRNSKDLKQALKLFQLAVELDPNYALAYVGQADTLSNLTYFSDLPRAEMLALGEPLLAKALELNPLGAEAHATKATYLIHKWQLQAAEESFQYSLTLNPNYTATYIWYGSMLRVYLGRPQEALTLHQKAAELDPLSAPIQSQIANDFRALGKYNQALQQLKKIVKFAPKYHLAFGSIAGVYYLQGDFVQSIFWRKKILEQDSVNFYQHMRLGMTYLDLGLIDSAKTVLNTMQNNFPNHPSTDKIQGLINIAEGKTKLWIDTIEDNNKKHPNKKHSKMDLAKGYLELENYPQAIKQLTDMMKKNKDDSVNINARNMNESIALVWSLKKVGRAKKSREILQQVKQLLPTIAKHNMGWTHFYLEAIEGNHKSAAILFAGLIDDSKYQSWSSDLVFPYLKEVKKQPEYIQAYKKLMGILEQQRKELAELESKGQTP